MGNKIVIGMPLTVCLVGNDDAPLVVLMGIVSSRTGEPMPDFSWSFALVLMPLLFCAGWSPTLHGELSL